MICKPTLDKKLLVPVFVCELTYAVDFYAYVGVQLFMLEVCSLPWIFIFSPISVLVVVSAYCKMFT